jgi:hypothetical protein
VSIIVFFRFCIKTKGTSKRLVSHEAARSISTPHL